MPDYKQGVYYPDFPEKYVGKKLPFCRSSWETKFCVGIDHHPGVIKWASENVRIPYQHPLTGKWTHYVPDFMVQYIDVNGQTHVELVEIKPSTQTTLEAAGKSSKNQQAVLVNTAKWAAAQEFCHKHSMRFRVINEDQLYHTKKKRVPKPRVPKRKR